MSSQSFRPNSPPIIQETIDQETIMVNLETGSYYSLNPTGSHIWAAMENGVHTDELAPDLAQRFAADVTSVEPDVRGFIDRLVQEELIVPRSDVSPASTLARVAPPPPAPAHAPPPPGGERSAATARRGLRASDPAPLHGHAGAAAAGPRARGGRRRVAGQALTAAERASLPGVLDAVSDQAAAAAGGFSEHHLGVARQSVRVRFAGPALVSHITRALAHLSVPPAPGSSLTIRVWDSHSTRVPAPVLDGEQHPVRGYIGSGGFFQWEGTSLSALDAQRGQG